MTMTGFPDLNAPSRVLLGPGPSMVHPRVLRAMMAPPVGHLDPYLLHLYQEEQSLLRYVFQTRNAWTFALSGTGTSGMEAALANLIEPGDAVLVAIHGYFGERMAEIAAGLGAEVDRIQRAPGEIFTVEEIASALARRRYKLLALVHAETSTGAEQLHIAEIAGCGTSTRARCWYWIRSLPSEASPSKWTSGMWMWPIRPARRTWEPLPVWRRSRSVSGRVSSSSGAKRRW
jgi:aspartate aminotransferase-like enzyme